MSTCFASLRKLSRPLRLGLFVGVVCWTLACSSADHSDSNPGSGGSGAATGGVSLGGAEGTTGGSIATTGGASLGGTAGTGALAGGTGGASAGGALSSGGAEAGGGATGGSMATGGTATGGVATGASGGMGGTTGGSGGAAGAAGGESGGLGGDAGGSPGNCVTADLVAANTTIGVEWSELPSATGYRIYWSDTAGVTPSDQSIDVTGPAYVHRGLTNGTTYHYSVAALTPEGETELCSEVSATPTGEWVLEQLGTGVFDDLVTGNPGPRVPIADRLHILIYPEGYLQTELGNFEDDVRDWIDEVFALDVYDAFRDAFVIWYLPRASNTHIGEGDTAFDVGVVDSGGTWVTGTISSSGETATRAWAAVDLFPYPPTDFSGGGFGTVRKLTAAFLLYDPDYGRAAVSGRTLSLRNPSDSAQRLAAAFGIDHHHEFTHGFAALYDEYMEEDLSGTQWPNDGTTNVVNTSTCSELPWSHLLAGAGINDTAELVGAFGQSHIGYHSEFHCLMNGGHDNPTYYGDSWLRVDRMCNFCREMTAFRIFRRSGIIDDISEWIPAYRNAFFERYGFSVPTPVPQENRSGTAYFEACSSEATRSMPRTSVDTSVSTRPRVRRGADLQVGCIQLDPDDVDDE